MNLEIELGLNLDKAKESLSSLKLPEGVATAIKKIGDFQEQATKSSGEGVGNQKKSVESLEKMLKLMKELAVASASIWIGKSMIGGATTFLDDAVNKVNQLNTASAELGESTQSIQRWSGLFAAAGLSTGDALSNLQAIKSLQTALSTGQLSGSQQAGFQRLNYYLGSSGMGGVTAVNSNGSLKSYSQLLTEITQKESAMMKKGVISNEQLQAINEGLGLTQNFNAVLTLSEQQRVDALTETITLSDQQEQSLRGLAVTSKLLANNTSTVGMELASSLAPSLEMVLGEINHLFIAFSNFDKKVGDIVEKSPVLAGVLKTVGAVLIGATVATGALAIGMGILTGATAAVDLAMAALDVLISPVSLAIIGVGAAVAVTYEAFAHWKEILGVLEIGLGDLVNDFIAFKNLIELPFDIAIASTLTLYQDLKKLATAILPESIIKPVQTAIDVIKQTITSFFSYLENLPIIKQIVDIADKIYKIASTSGNALQQQGEQLVKEGTAQGVKQGIQESQDTTQATQIMNRIPVKAIEDSLAVNPYAKGLYQQQSMSRSSTSHQVNSIAINVNGSGNPVGVASAIVGKLSSALSSFQQSSQEIVGGSTL